MHDAGRSAVSAGLRYVVDSVPGIRRSSGSKGFRYTNARGRIIRRPSELKRIASLAVPPAWTDVWICSDPRGHLQATGRDQRGRKQYRYHRAWRTFRDETKYDQLPSLAAVLPRLRARLASDVARSGLPRDKVLAAVVQLLERSLIRVGNDEYAKQNGSFGLTTLRDSHVSVRGPSITFQFKGKSGVKHSVDVTNRRLARIVKQCRDLPGQELFQYVDGSGCRRSVTSSDVNDYLRSTTGEAFTAKDFRTWAGTVLAVTALRACGGVSTQTRLKRNVLRTFDAVAAVLGNTRAVCRASYVHPAVIEAYMEGALERICRGPVVRHRRTMGLRDDEVIALRVLEWHASRATRKGRAA